MSEYFSSCSLPAERRPLPPDAVEAWLSRWWRGLFPERKLLGQSRFYHTLQALDSDYAECSEAELKTKLQDAKSAEHLLQRFIILQHLAGKKFAGRRHRPVSEIEPMIELWRAYLIYNGQAVSGYRCERETGLAAAALALEGTPVHLVYADSESLQQAKNNLAFFFNELDLSTGFVDKKTPASKRREQYRSAICFCLAQELVFDYLRDRLQLGDMTQALRLQAEVLYRETPRIQKLNLPGLHVALIADIDRLLMDAARAPLEITGDSENNSSRGITRARLSYPGFFRRYKQLGGYGDLSGLEFELWEVYRLGVIRPKEKQRADATEHRLHVYRHEADKWSALLKKIKHCREAQRPVCLSVETQDAAEKIKSLLTEENIAFEINASYREAQVVQGSANLPVNLLLSDSGVSLPEQACLLFIEYHSPRVCRRREAMVGSVPDCETVFSFVALDEQRLNVIVGHHSGLRLLVVLLGKLINPDSKIGNYFSHRLLYLADKISEGLQAKVRRKLLRQEIQQGKKLSFAGTGE